MKRDYYWIGTRAFWQPVGNIFSTLEIAPFSAMVIFSFSMVWRARLRQPNTAALLWALGCPACAFFGAGVWGFMHTLSWVNYYSHGTQATASHAHLAFYGAYVMLNMAIFSYAMPYLRNLPPYNQVLNMWSFWIMKSGVAFMTFTLTFAGVVQTHLQRVLGSTYMEVQDQLVLFYWTRLGAGVVTMLGGFMFTYAVLGPARIKKAGWIETAPMPAWL